MSMENAQRLYDMQSDDRDCEDEESDICEHITDEEADQAERMHRELATPAK